MDPQLSEARSNPNKSTYHTYYIYEMTVAAAGKAVQVGVGVMIMHQGKVLVGKRIGSHGAGTLLFFDPIYGSLIEEPLLSVGKTSSVTNMLLLVQLHQPE